MGRGLGQGYAEVGDVSGEGEEGYAAEDDGDGAVAEGVAL